MVDLASMRSRGFGSVTTELSNGSGALEGMRLGDDHGHDYHRHVDEHDLMQNEIDAIMSLSIDNLVMG